MILMAHTINIVAWNVRGLGDASKRYAVFSEVRAFQPAIICLSETHLTSDRIQLLRRSWIGQAYHSTYSTHARGVSVLVHKNIPYTCHRVKVDSEGRYVCILCTIYSQLLILVAIYIPPPYSSTIFKEILTFLDPSPGTPVLLVGDFNNYIHPYYDKLHSGTIAVDARPTSLARLLGEIGLCDLWRLQFPDRRQYSCYSSTHHSLSRIDLAVGSDSIIPLIGVVEYLTRGISDHSPIRVQLKLGRAGELHRKLWRLNPFWIQLIGPSPLVELREFFTNNEGSASKACVWDTMKAFVRGIYIREISKRKSKTRELTVAYQHRVGEAERDYVESPSAAGRVQLEEAQKSLADHLLHRADDKRFFLQQKYYDQGESAGHLLATVVRSQMGSSHITKLISEDGVEVTDGNDISNVLMSFYRSLYSSGSSGNLDAMAAYLSNVSLPSLSDSSRLLLEQPISCEELEEALKLFPNDKAPGSDGLPVEFFKSFREVLLPPLLEVFQEALDKGRLPPSMREAVIVLLPKPDKDLTRPGSYRPISLLPVDVKILAKVLACRLGRVVREVVHGDQAGFMPNMSTAVNLRRLYLNLQLCPAESGARAILSLDAAKAFDSVEWDFLWAVMGRMGFGPQFISYVKLLYVDPVAKIRSGHQLSDPFVLGRGTRQGCPLSPLLFALAIEPLACVIRSSRAIMGFRCREAEERISLYADDILLYLGDVESSLEPVMTLIRDFGDWSGLRINWDKSVLLPVDPLPGALSLDAVPLQIVSEFSYLGVRVNARPLDYLRLNVLPLLARIADKVDSWCRLPLTVIGRGNLTKMILMPQILYILHNSPIWIPMYVFHKINRLFRELIWKKKNARVKLETLQRDKDAGGLAIPNPWLYFVASQLQHFSGWARVDESGAAGRLIRAWSGWSNLGNWLEIGGHGVSRSRFPTLALIYKVWDRGKRALGLNGFSRFSPIWRNPMLPEFGKLSGFESWKSLGIYTLDQLQVHGDLKSFEQLQSEFNLPPRAIFSYLRLKHAYMTQAQVLDLTVSNNFALERILRSSFTAGLISWAYRDLLTAQSQDCPLSIRSKWEREVGPLTDAQWNSLLELTPLLSLSESQRLSQIFLLHRVYRSPDFLFKIGVRDDSCCPRCSRPNAHIMHMLWECPRIGQFWTEVLRLIETVFGVVLDPQPKLCILGLIDEIVSPQPRYLGVSRMLFQARKLLAFHWIDPSPPTVTEYIKRMNHILRLEEGVYKKRNALHKFERIWGPWLESPGLPSGPLLHSRMFLRIMGL